MLQTPNQPALGSTSYADVVKACAVLFIIIFSFYTISSSLLFSTFSSVILFAIILLGVSYVRLPPPNESVVEHILGKNLYTHNGGADDLFKVGAHRGAGLDAPENTIAAFKYCADKQCKMVELDVSLTKDDVPIVFHDSTLERLTERDNIVKQMTWKELSDVEIQHPLKERFPNSRLAKFDVAIEQCLELGHRLFIDVKEHDFKIVDVILDLFKKHNDLYSKAVVSSFNPSIIYMVRRRDPKIVCSLAYRPYFFSHASYDPLIGPDDRRSKNPVTFAGLLGMDKLWKILFPLIGYHVIGISVVLLQKDVVSRDIIREWNKRGIRVVAWTVNLPLEKQYFTKILKIPYLTDTLIGENFKGDK